MQNKGAAQLDLDSLVPRPCLLGDDQCEDQLLREARSWGRGRVPRAQSRWARAPFRAPLLPSAGTLSCTHLGRALGGGEKAGSVLSWKNIEGS